MTARIVRWVLVLLALGIGPYPAMAQEGVAARGAALLQPYKQALAQALGEALQRGPQQAVAVCSTEASRLASRFSRDGITMGRSSHRLRNPANAAARWLEPVLTRYTTTTHRAQPSVCLLPDGRWAYVEPIYIQPRCLLCHGRQVPASVARTIARQYPGDRAVGFDPGQFRGVFWVVFPAAPKPQ